MAGGGNLLQTRETGSVTQDELRQTLTEIHALHGTLDEIKAIHGALDRQKDMDDDIKAIKAKLDSTK